MSTIDAARLGGSVPSYSLSLLLIGGYLNAQRARTVTIAEIDTGFLLFFFQEGKYTQPKQLSIHHTDLLELNGAFAPAKQGRKGGVFETSERPNKKHPLLPMGYDVFLYAIGDRLHRKKGTSITISETHETLYVNYWMEKSTFIIRDQRRTAVSNEQLETFTAKTAATLIASTRATLETEASRYESALRVNPHDHISMLQLGLLLEDQGDFRAAEALYSRVANKVPDHPEIYYHIARLALVRGDRRTALDAIRSAMTLRGEEAPLLDILGRAQRQGNKLQDAATAFERATELDPDNDIYHYHLAKAYEAQGRHEDAAAEMARITRQEAAPAWTPEDDNEANDASASPPPSRLQAAPVDTSPAAAALLPALSTSPAAAALLPPSSTAAASGDSDWASAASSIAQTPPVPRRAPDSGLTTTQFTTEFETSLPSPWQQQPVPRGAAPDPQPAVAPQLTPFPAEPAPTAAPWQGQHPAPPQQQWQTPPSGWPQAQTPQVPLQAPPQQWQQAPQAQWQQQPMPQQQPQPQWQQPPVPSQAPQPQWQMPQQPAVPVPQPAQQWQQPVQYQQPPQIYVPAPQPAAGEPAHTPTLEQRMRAAVPPPIPPSNPMPNLDPSSWAGPATNGSESTQQAAGETLADPAATGPNSVEIAAEIMVIQRAIEAEPNRADLHRKLGFLLARQGRTAEAATEFRKALQCSRTNL